MRSGGSNTKQPQPTASTIEHRDSEAQGLEDGEQGMSNPICYFDHAQIQIASSNSIFYYEK